MAEVRKFVLDEKNIPTELTVHGSNPHYIEVVTTLVIKERINVNAYGVYSSPQEAIADELARTKEDVLTYLVDALAYIPGDNISMTRTINAE